MCDKIPCREGFANSFLRDSPCLPHQQRNRLQGGNISCTLRKQLQNLLYQVFSQVVQEFSFIGEDGTPGHRSTWRTHCRSSAKWASSTTSSSASSSRPPTPPQPSRVPTRRPTCFTRHRISRCSSVNLQGAVCTIYDPVYVQNNVTFQFFQDSISELQEL